MSKPTPGLYPTSNFYLSTYLIAHGLPLIDCDRDGRGRATFLFRDSDELIQRVNEYTFGEKSWVDAGAFVGAIKRLKTLLYDVT